MKKRKKSWMLSLLCFTLLGILVFAGCSSKTMSDSNNSDLTPLAEGGYEENEISPPE